VDANSSQIAFKYDLFGYLKSPQLVMIQVQIGDILMEYDYIIVGAGSAGCVMANRLSENPAKRVLLLEAGGSDSNPFIHMPAGLAQLASNTKVNWSYQTEPQTGLKQRRMYSPWQGPWWFQLDQRHDLYPRPGTRLRSLGITG